MLQRLENYSQGIEDWVNSQIGDELNPVEKGKAFCQWCLENIFDLASDQAIDAMDTSGAFDHGIDAFVSFDDGEIHIIQTKFGSAHSWGEITKFHYDMQRIRDGKVKETEANDAVLRIIADIQDALEADKDVKFHYITNAEFTPTERTKIVQIETNRTEFLFFDLSKIVDFLDRKQQDVPDSIRGRWLPLKLSTREILKFEQTTAVIAVSLGNMHDFAAQAGDDLFASNVRQYLRGTKINTGIRKTIQENPERFWLYNNGITIVCDDFVEENFSIKIQTPQIVNGCQTAKSIWDILSKRRAQERYSIPGHVLVRIIKGADEAEKENITRYTNTQNAVRGKDFFSLEQFQKRLQKRFKSLGYYYEIQRGSFASLKPSERSKYTGISELAYLVDSRFKNLIPAMDATQAFTAGFKQVPAVAYGTPYDLAPNGSWYDKVFDESLQPEPKAFLYPLLIREWARNHGYSRGGEGGWRAHSALFFVYTYFVVLVEVLKKRGYIEPLATSPQEVPLEYWDKVFAADSLNGDLLSITDEILERYFTDSSVYEAVGLDVRKFLKNQDTLDKHRAILIRLIEIVVFSTRQHKLVEQFDAILR